MPLPLESRRHHPENPWTYSLLDAYQREIAEAARGGAPGALLLSEVAPVITLGRRLGDSGQEELRAPREWLAQQGIEVYPTDRGGLATYHGPGQWVLFPVDRLETLTGDPRGVRRIVESLLEIARRVGARYRDCSEIRQGCEQGVWSRHGKFAAVGIQIEKGIVLHGLSINAFRTPQSFQGLRPCGLDAPIDYLLEPEASVLAAAERELRFERLGQEIAEAAQEVLKRSPHSRRQPVT